MKKATTVVLLVGLLTAFAAGVAGATSSVKFNPVDCDGGKCQGTVRPDKITGTNSRDEIHARDEYDIVKAKGGRDTIYGGPGSDRLSGGSGGDTIYGGAGKDVIYGESGNDLIDVADGEPGDTADCGEGSGDKVRFDSGDTLVDCEVFGENPTLTVTKAITDTQE